MLKPGEFNEAHFAEIEKTLLYLSDARRRAEKAIKELKRDKAEPHLVTALETAERELEVVARRLMQQTYFAVPKDQLELVPEPEPVEELTLS